MRVYKQLGQWLTSQEKRALLGIAILFVAVGFFEMLGLGLIFVYVSMILQPVEYSDLIEKANAITQFLGLAPDHILYGGLVVAVMFIIKNLFIWVSYYIFVRFTYRKYTQIGSQLFEGYLNAPYRVHLDRNSSQLQRNLTIELAQTFNNVLYLAVRIFADAASTLLVMGLLFYIAPALMLVVTLFLAVTGFSMHKIYERFIVFYGEDRQVATGRMMDLLNQALFGFKELKILHRERFFNQRLLTELSRVTKATGFIRIVEQMPRLAGEALFAVAIVIAVIFSIRSGASLEGLIPVMGILALAGIRIIIWLQRIMSYIQGINYYMPSARIISEELEAISRQPAATGSSGSDAEVTRPSTPFKKTLEIQKISFNYDDLNGDDVISEAKREAALTDISLTIKKDTSVAFVGSSGAGKSTLIDLILGLLQPQSGEILIDLKPITEDLSGWQQNIGYVPQHIHLIDGTIRENVLFGLPLDQADDEQVWQALKVAQLTKFIEEQPDGLETMVGENGIKLSGGQRQRVGIARALYHDPNVLVLDEATAALDNITERNLTQTLYNLRGTKTMIYVAHRLSTVKHCDCLYFMENGRVVASGTYDQLVADHPQFREFTHTLEDDLAS